MNPTHETTFWNIPRSFEDVKKYIHDAGERIMNRTGAPNHLQDIVQRVMCEVNSSLEEVDWLFNKKVVVPNPFVLTPFPIWSIYSALAWLINIDILGLYQTITNQADEDVLNDVELAYRYARMCALMTMHLDTSKGPGMIQIWRAQCAEDAIKVRFLWPMNDTTRQAWSNLVDSDQYPRRFRGSDLYFQDSGDAAQQSHGYSWMLTEPPFISPHFIFRVQKFSAIEVPVPKMITNVPRDEVHLVRPGLCKIDRETVYSGSQIARTHPTGAC
ncbi:unnamed protein product [Somion occarium]|uniref:Mating-type protein MAT1-1-2 n=1 Tax=Somion occarium TaxID=3059160 RepID=A0ABP1DMY1_9APHY